MVHTSSPIRVRRNNHILYAPTVLIRATLPHRRVDGTEFMRTNGNYCLSILAPSRVGIPFGTIPRLVMIWITTQIKITNSRDIYMGRSCRQFMASLGLDSTGGKQGSIGRLRQQMGSLFQCAISFYEHTEFSEFETGMRIADASAFWWSPMPQIDFEAGYLRVSEVFFNEVMRAAFPVDARAIRQLRQSPLALDIYMWLTHRVYSLGKPCFISWGALSEQFGSSYKHLWHFEAAFVRSLTKVKQVYPEIEVYIVRGNGLRLYPSKTHVSASCE